MRIARRSVGAAAGVAFILSVPAVANADHAANRCADAESRCSPVSTNGPSALGGTAGVGQGNGRLVALRSQAGKPKNKRRHCTPIPHPAGASTVTAYNMKCAPARKIVAITTRRGGVAPKGWSFINPAGCEGFIIRASERPWARRNLRIRPGTQGISVTIYAGCNS